MNSFACSAIYTLNAGYLQEFDDSHNYWNPGIGVSVGAFYPVHPYILLGGHFLFNRWTPAESPPNGIIGTGWRSSGSAWFYSIYPAIRVTTSKDCSDNFWMFFHLGAGLTIIRSSAELEITPVIPGGISTYADLVDSQSRAGINLGAGCNININESVGLELLPLYNIVFTPDEVTEYFSASIGVALRM